MRLVRTWLPLVICLVGVAVIVIRRDETGWEGGAAFIGAGLSVLLLNYLHRFGVAGDREREEEDEARAYFDRHGRWPDDDGGR